MSFNPFIHACHILVRNTHIFLPQPSGPTAGLDALCQTPLGMGKGEEPEHQVNYPSQFVHRQMGNSLDISSIPKCVVLTSVSLILHWASLWCLSSQTKMKWVEKERKKEMEARVSVGIRYLIRVWGETREWEEVFHVLTSPPGSSTSHIKHVIEAVSMQHI